ncbi:hypothetical protein PABY_07220 [Pyrodictium abyssi]|uniref:Uncharacterized protein n=1 Tax=Pyrodictium abyssi TaxID=54256 RepID=A0ABM8IUE9_9CREN|nr:hypothetical protein PABY_07220 [Pyrodictium abyssi]
MNSAGHCPCIVISRVIYGLRAHSKTTKNIAWQMIEEEGGWEPGSTNPLSPGLVEPLPQQPLHFTARQRENTSI